MIVPPSALIIATHDGHIQLACGGGVCVCVVWGWCVNGVCSVGVVCEWCVQCGGSVCEWCVYSVEAVCVTGVCND